MSRWMPSLDDRYEDDEIRAMERRHEVHVFKEPPPLDLRNAVMIGYRLPLIDGDDER